MSHQPASRCAQARRHLSPGSSAVADVGANWSPRYSARPQHSPLRLPPWVARHWRAELHRLRRASGRRRHRGGPSLRRRSGRDRGGRGCPKGGWDRQDQVRAVLLRDLEAARYAADRAFRQSTPPTRPTALWLVNWKRVGTRRLRASPKLNARSPPMTRETHVPAGQSDVARRSSSRPRACWTAPPPTRGSRSVSCAPSSMRSSPISTKTRPRSFCSSIGWAASTARFACRDDDGATQQHLARHHHRRWSAGADRQR